MSSPLTPREEKLLKLLQKKGYASIQELAEELSVSSMTVHRSLKRLAAGGHIVKTRGGASLASAKAGRDGCGMCGKPLMDRTLFIIHLPGGEQRRACCAHCGLMLQAQSGGVSMTADFLHNHIVSASQAVYLLQSELTVCCAPSVLTFGSRADAEKFQKGFGGTLANMEEAIQFLHGTMIMKPAGNGQARENLRPRSFGSVSEARPLAAPARAAAAPNGQQLLRAHQSGKDYTRRVLV